MCVCHSGIKDVLDKLEETEPELEEIMHVTVNSGGDFDAANGSHLVEVNEVCNQQIYSSVYLILPCREKLFPVLI